jgi:hypothetical protein
MKYEESVDLSSSRTFTTDSSEGNSVPNKAGSFMKGKLGLPFRVKPCRTTAKKTWKPRTSAIKKHLQLFTPLTPAATQQLNSLFQALDRLEPVLEQEIGAREAPMRQCQKTFKVNLAASALLMRRNALKMTICA